jgi:hypothetical protein
MQKIGCLVVALSLVATAPALGVLNQVEFVLDPTPVQFGGTAFGTILIDQGTWGGGIGSLVGVFGGGILASVEHDGAGTVQGIRFKQGGAGAMLAPDTGNWEPKRDATAGADAGLWGMKADMGLNYALAKFWDVEWYFQGVFNPVTENIDDIAIPVVAGVLQEDFMTGGVGPMGVYLWDSKIAFSAGFLGSGTDNFEGTEALNMVSLAMGNQSTITSVPSATPGEYDLTLTIPFFLWYGVDIDGNPVGTFTWTGQFVANGTTPEPTSIVLIGLGLLGIVSRRRIW